MTGSKSLTDEWKTTRKGLIVSGMWVSPTQKGLATAITLTDVNGLSGSQLT